MDVTGTCGNVPFCCVDGVGVENKLLEIFWEDVLGPPNKDDVELNSPPVVAGLSKRLPPGFDVVEPNKDDVFC